MSLGDAPTVELKNLTELEGSDWGKSSSDSYIERSCHELRFKPLADLEVEDLRLFIGQSIGLRHLMPIALNTLRKNPLAEGMHYPGDLLSSVLRADPTFYLENSGAALEIQDIAQKAIVELDGTNGQLQKYPLEGVTEALAIFRATLTRLLSSRRP